MTQNPGFPGVLPSSGGGGGTFSTGVVNPNGVVDGHGGDTYYDSASGDVYVCVGGTVWAAAAGGTYSTGVVDPNGVVTGVAGDTYYDSVTGNVYTCVGGTVWIVGFHLHHTTHENGGSDEISVAGLSGVLADAQTAAAHHTTHESGGSDAIKLDDLSTPDDNTDLDASTSAHGLLPKLPDDWDYILDGTGEWVNNPFGIDKFYYKVGPTSDYATVDLALAAGVARAPEGSTICFLIDVEPDASYMYIGFKIAALTLPNTHNFVFESVKGPMAPVYSGDIPNVPSIYFEGELTLTEWNGGWFPVVPGSTTYLDVHRTVTFKNLHVRWNTGYKTVVKWGRSLSFKDCTVNKHIIDLTAEGCVVPGAVTSNSAIPPCLLYQNCIGASSGVVNLLNPAGVHAGSNSWQVRVVNSTLSAWSVVKDPTQASVLYLTILNSLFWLTKGNMFDLYSASTVRLTNVTFSITDVCTLFTGALPDIAFFGAKIVQTGAGAWSLGLTNFTSVIGHPTIESYVTAPSDSAYPVGTLMPKVAGTGVYQQWNGTTWEYLGDQTLAHAASHENGGSDKISVAGLSGELADDQPPKAHATDHESGGSDAIKLDDLAAPDDNTDLDASTSAHGLLSKLPNDANQVLDGTGTWTPSVPVEVLTPAASVAIDIDTPKAKSLAIAHDVTFTLSNATAGRSTTVFVYIANDSGADRAMAFPAAWEWGSFEPNGIMDGDKGLLVISTVGTVVTASYALLEVAPDAPKYTAITVADSPYTPSPQEVIHVDASGGDVTIQLPGAATWPQVFGFVAKRDALDVSGNAMIIDADTGPSELVDGAATYSTTVAGESVTVVPIPTGNWLLV